MRKVALLAAACAGLALAQPAGAKNLQPQDPVSIVQAIKDAGLPATLTVDDNAPKIETSYDGTNFFVYLLNCTNKADCRTIQFYSGYSDTGTTLSRLNEWNRTKRFARAYLDDDGAVWVEMDVDMDKGGISPELFHDNLEFWLGLMADFERHIGYRNAN